MTAPDDSDSDDREPGYTGPDGTASRSAIPDAPAAARLTVERWIYGARTH